MHVGEPSRTATLLQNDSPKISRLVEPRASEIRAGEANGAQVGAFEVRVAEKGAREVSLAQLGIF